MSFTSAGIRTLVVGLAVAAASPTILSAQEQERPVGWQRRGAPSEAPVAVFHSPHSINFPTAENLLKGEWLFEISHRFVPPVSDGSQALWGFDGPVNLRLGLGWAFSDRATVTLQRSNLEDNLELNVKAQLWNRRSDRYPLMVAAQAGAAWNGELNEVTPEPDPWQYYAMLLINQGLGGSVAVGVVPAYLRNPNVYSESADNAFSLGVHGQWYFATGWSALGEWNFSDAWGERVEDTGSFGVELETGGHFFKLILTNAVELNPTQFLAGTAASFEPNEWRIGFNITRLIRF